MHGTSVRRGPVTIAFLALLTLLGGCGGGGGGDGGVTPPTDRPPTWGGFSWQYRGGYGVLSATATDPDGTATAITCTGALAKSYTSSALDSLALPPTSSAQTVSETCDATSNGKSAGTQSGQFVIPAATGSMAVASARASG